MPKQKDKTNYLVVEGTQGVDDRGHLRVTAFRVYKNGRVSSIRDKGLSTFILTCSHSTVYLRVLRLTKHCMSTNLQSFLKSISGLIIFPIFHMLVLSLGKLSDVVVEQYLLSLHFCFFFIFVYVCAYVRLHIRQLKSGYYL